MNATDNQKITSQNIALTGALGSRAALPRAASATHASEFQSSMQKNRSARQGSHVEMKSDSRTWIPGAPLEDQPTTSVTRDADRDCGRMSPCQSDLDADETLARPPGLERSRFADHTSSNNAFLGADNALIMSLAQNLDASTAAAGQFDLLLPSGHGIGVHYQVTPEVTQVLLRATSTMLSQQLKQCANGIGSALSERSGRLVEVTAV